MPRIAGVDLPRDKRVEIALTYIFGIGRSRARRVLEETGIDPDTRMRDITEEEAVRLREAIERDYTIEGDLRREVQGGHYLSNGSVLFPRWSWLRCRQKKAKAASYQKLEVVR